MVVRKIVGGYLFIGGLVSMAMVFSQLNLFQFITGLLPAIISVVIMSIPVIGGAIKLFSNRAGAGCNLIFISLLIQSFQISIFGVTFVNYFDPTLAIGLTDTPFLTTTFEFHALSIADKQCMVKDSKVDSPG